MSIYLQSAGNVGSAFMSIKDKLRGLVWKLFLIG